MTNTSKWLLATFSAALLVVLSSCSSQKKPSLKVAATPIPHAQILEAARSELKEQGIDLDIVIVDDYHIPNRALVNHEVDANFFQHLPFLQSQIEQFHYPIECFAQVEIEPLGIYSYKLKSLNDLAIGSTIAIPNDPSNEARALLLLQAHGLISLEASNMLQATIRNIISNPKQLKFIEIDAPMLARSLQDVQAAVINTNYALQAGLSPLKDALAVEGNDSPYVNVLVIRKGEGNRSDLQALKNSLTNDRMRVFIQETYQGAVLPAF